MTYQQTIDYLFTSLPMFQRIGNTAIKKDLTNIKKLCTLLGHPQKRFSSIHIAGTNGKGSTSHMLASIFQAAGKKVGLYTSPHYVDFRERIKVNGRMISKNKVIDFVEQNKKSWKEIQPSFFEITVAMAFDHFAKQKVDIAIIETGLGGRLDSTNIISPLLSVITNIGYDHMQMLGSSLPEIAAEKAGIIKKNIPVVIGEWQKETYRVFREKAVAMRSPLTFASKKIFMTGISGNQTKTKYHLWTRFLKKGIAIETDLAGPYQEKNIKTVIEACRVWNIHYTDDYLTEKSIKSGLKNARKNTNMLGRWMVIRNKPLVITDAAHNIDGIKTIMPALEMIHAKEKHFVLGFVSDKDISKILSLFPKNAHYYWCSPDIPRGKPAIETQAEGNKIGLHGEAFPSVGQAYRYALTIAGKEDFIYVGGSSYVVGDLLASL